MKKKVNIFGKSVPVFVLVLLGMGLVSAALVPYLSGVVSGNVDVDSPVLLRAADDASTLSVEWTEQDQLPVDNDFTAGVGTLDLTTQLYGGDGEGFWIKAENLADVPIESNLVFELRETSGIGITMEGEGNDIVGDLNAEMTIYDWVDGNKVVVGPLDAENDVLVTISPIEQIGSSDEYNAVRIYALGSYLFATNTYGDEYYVFVDFDFELNALGDYEIRAAFLNDPIDGAFPTA